MGTTYIIATIVAIVFIGFGIYCYEAEQREQNKTEDDE